MATACATCSSSSTTHCTVCHVALCADHTKMGQPFITARQLVTTTATTAFRAPAMLNDLLFKELDLVPYCVDCRDELASRRTGEQLKVLLGMLLVIALVIGIPAYIMLAG